MNFSDLEARLTIPRVLWIMLRAALHTLTDAAALALCGTGPTLHTILDNLTQERP